MNVYLPFTARLPSAYQEVEYLETTGTQYITTSITPNTNTQVEVKIEVTTTAMDKTIFGTNRGSTYYHLTPYSNAWYYGLNGSESHAGTYSNVVGTQYEVVYNNSNSQLSINGTEVGSTSGTTSTNPLEIAKRASDNTKGVFKYFYFNVYNKSTSEYLLKLVPCYRKSDNVIGMYDLVNDQFYTNSGTGTFSKGNDVTMSVLKNIYIGEYKGWTPGANTVAYYPLTSDFNDASGNSRNLTNSGATIGTYGGVTCAYYDGGDYSYYSGYGLNSPRTICLRGYNTNTTSSAGGLIHISQYSNIAPSGSLGLQYIGSSIITPTDWSSASAEIKTSITSGWHNIVVTEDSSRTVTLYIDGVSKGTKSYSSPATPDGWSLGSKFYSAFSEKLRGYLSNVILESTSWTAQEISNYYNQTKSNYGL